MRPNTCSICTTVFCFLKHEIMCLDACLNDDSWFNMIRINVYNVHVKIKVHVEHEMMILGFNMSQACNDVFWLDFMLSMNY